MVALSAVGATLWGIGQTVIQDGGTVVRIRGEALLWISSASAALDGFQSYGMGICKVSDSAFLFGVSAVPSPLTEISWEGWIWHHTGAALVSPSSVEGDVMGPVGSIRIPIDSKAMRKTGTDETICGVVELGTEVGTAIAQFSARTRMLFKLP